MIVISHVGKEAAHLTCRQKKYFSFAILPFLFWELV